MRTFDFVIVGAGIMGLTIARALRRRLTDASILVLEKENSFGVHASGRNSGVLHSGIYYEQGSLKARLCAGGARLMAEYCRERRLPLAQWGKVVVPTSGNDDATLDLLYNRAVYNGAHVELIDAKQLREIEPAARSASGRALFVPETSVIEPNSILRSMVADLEAQRVAVCFGERVIEVDEKARNIRGSQRSIGFGKLINAAGLHADALAKRCGVGGNYQILPFKGIYYDLQPSSSLKIKRLIYPVPDLGVPFLGVHFTKSVVGGIYIGPTAVPAFGRENYRGWNGVSITEACCTMYRMAGLYAANRQGFRRYAHEETTRCIKRNFVATAKKLVPALVGDDLRRSTKTGIRAQLFDLNEKTLVHDFIVEKGRHSLHILNAVSPAFTSSLSLSEMIVGEYLTNGYNVSRALPA